MQKNILVRGLYVTFAEQKYVQYTFIDIEIRFGKMKCSSDIGNVISTSTTKAISAFHTLLMINRINQC